VKAAAGAMRFLSMSKANHAEAEYVAASQGLRSFTVEIFRPLTPLLCDKQGAISFSEEGRFHARTKHIDIRYHFIHFVICKGVV
jgi:hypothetical protein